MATTYTKIAFPKVSQYMDNSVPTVHPDTSILDAVERMLDQGVTGLPVVDANGAIVGIITEYDCLRLVSAGTPQHAEAPRDDVGAYMTTDVVTATPDMDIYYAAGIFLGHRFRRLPVVRDGRLIGAITRYDCLRAIRTHAE